MSPIVRALCRSLALRAALAAVFPAQDVRAEEITIATGPTFIEKVFDPIKKPLKDATGLEVKILVNGPVPSLGELEKGNAQLAGASLALEDWLASAEKQGLPLKDKAAFQPFIVMKEATVVIVNSANKVGTLTKEQLKGIFTEKITNWKEVGGSDAPIIVVWPQLSSGALTTFQKQMMDGEAPTKSVLDVQALGDIPQAVGTNPEAIGIANKGVKATGVRVVDAPKIERPLVLVSKGAPSKEVQKLLTYLTGDGQKHLK